MVAHWPSIRKVAGSVPLVVVRFPRPGARGAAPRPAWHGSRNLVGSAVPQVTERGIGLVGHASSLNDHSDNMPVSVGSCDFKTVGRFCRSQKPKFATYFPPPPRTELTKNERSAPLTSPKSSRCLHRHQTHNTWSTPPPQCLPLPLQLSPKTKTRRRKNENGKRRWNYL